ncbi:uncharacterized protein C2orf81 homolog [Pezoporus flaviventris]|uniref:uncharacterized protein C2orf81 homolog n=1 Tax=Pezoporus flaviventris TaxID=889875 RepID=UPI002AB0F555|nr:uncharacterized protein C2orf81 homolog [Pezoporus flaviventris]
MYWKAPSRERAAPSRPRGDRPRPPPGSPPAGPEHAAPWLRQELGRQRGDSAVGGVLRDLLQRVLSQCGRARARRERVPFTVGHVRDVLLHMAQWRFPLRDEGTLDPEGEDEEPQPCTSDSWAEGAVPVLSTRCCPGEVSDPCPPLQAGQQDPDEVADAGSSPVEPPFPGDASGGSDTAPGPPPPPQDEAASGPRFFEGKSARAQAPVPRAAPLRPARPPAPPEPPGPDRPPRPCGGEEGSAALSGHKPRLPPLSRSSVFSLWSARAPCGSVPRRGGSGSVLAVPGPCPGRRPERWIRPHVEVLEPGAGRRSRGPVPAAGSQPQPAAAESRPPPGAAPRPLGSLLDPARLAPGVSVRWGGSVRRGGHGEREQEQEEPGELRPVCPSEPPAVIAAGRVTGEQ